MSDSERSESVNDSLTFESPSPDVDKTRKFASRKEIVRRR